MLKALFRQLSRNIGNTEWLAAENRKDYNRWLSLRMASIKQLLSANAYQIRGYGEWLDAAVTMDASEKGREIVLLKASDDIFVRFEHRILSDWVSWKPGDGVLIASYFRGDELLSYESSGSWNLALIVTKLMAYGDIRYAPS